MTHFVPLAHQLRPNTHLEYVGQSHLMGENGPIKVLMDTKSPTNLILWGPPGVGKTTLAHLLSKAWDANWHAINATLSSIQEIKKIIQSAKEAQQYGQRSVLFIDELHRFSKTQQDTLLSVVEDGTLILLGATTENPRFSVIPGLVSRSAIYECKALTSEELKRVLDHALQAISNAMTLDAEAMAALLAYAGGDARRLINSIEWLINSMDEAGVVTHEKLLKILPEAIRTLDDTTHYDLSSALIKSMRGSDVDAAVYWLARLITSGEDPIFLARRLVIFAAEDIGNADPQAITLAVSVMQGLQTIGMPEGRILLSQAVTYLSSAPKSNASYLAINHALEKIATGDLQSMPPHLRTNHSQAMSHEKGSYKYPHDYPFAVVAQQYWTPKYRLYEPKEIGYEREIKKRLDWICVKKNQGKGCTNYPL